MNRRQFVTEYLRFSRKDRIGGLVLLIIIGAGIFLPLFFTSDEQIQIKEDLSLVTAIDTLNQKQTNALEANDNEPISYQPEPTIRNNFSKGELFTFDPNITSAEGWKKLGLNQKTIQTIINYRNKGGKFYKAEDLKKIWGLPEGFYDHVKEYITIKTEETKAEKLVFAADKKKTWNVDINTADSLALMALPGIGSKLASRIINFRDKLGGFYSVNQISETYGVVDSTFQKIKPFLHVSGEVEKLNINSCTKDNLKNHPYIKWNLANAIVEYRNQHGSFKQLDDLKNITILDEPTFNKIVHYLSL